MQEPVYPTEDEDVSVVTVSAETHAEAIENATEKLTAGLAWDTVKLVRKEQLTGSNQLFTLRFSAETVAGW